MQGVVFGATLSHPAVRERCGKPANDRPCKTSHGVPQGMRTTPGLPRPHNILKSFTSTLFERADSSCDIEAPDVNEDGHVIPVVANGEANELLIGDGTGNFTSTLFERTYGSTNIEATDVNEDGTTNNKIECIHLQARTNPQSL
eukprot:SAG31_NODE_270_length_18732_cov_9.342618_16_plen_144_part_00